MSCYKKWEAASGASKDLLALLFSHHRQHRFHRQSLSLSIGSHLLSVQSAVLRCHDTHCDAYFFPNTLSVPFRILLLTITSQIASQLLTFCGLSLFYKTSLHLVSIPGTYVAITVFWGAFGKHWACLGPTACLFSYNHQCVALRCSLKPHRNTGTIELLLS